MKKSIEYCVPIAACIWEKCRGQWQDYCTYCRLILNSSYSFYLKSILTQLLYRNIYIYIYRDRRDDFVESVTLMFYEDFISNEHGLIKILYLFRALVEVRKN